MRRREVKKKLVCCVKEGIIRHEMSEKKKLISKVVSKQGRRSEREREVGG